MRGQFFGALSFLRKLFFERGNLLNLRNMLEYIDKFPQKTINRKENNDDDNNEN